MINWRTSSAVSNYASRLLWALIFYFRRSLASRSYLSKLRRVFFILCEDADGKSLTETLGAPRQNFWEGQIPPLPPVPITLYHSLPSCFLFPSLLSLSLE